jgi:hypothetical protein
MKSSFLDYPEDEGSKPLRIVGTYRAVRMTSHPRRQEYSVKEAMCQKKMPVYDMSRFVSTSRNSV